jgi:hypothetical protein
MKRGDTTGMREFRRHKAGKSGNVGQDLSRSAESSRAG